jgi:zinc protease
MHRARRRPHLAPLFLVPLVPLVPLVTLTACIASPMVTPTTQPVRYAVSQSALPSGMQTVFEVAPDFGVAGVVLAVGAGSADEPADRQGLAHLVEHLVILGRHGGTRFDDRLREVGVGDLNAFTDWDATTFYAFGSPTTVGPVVSLFMDMLDDPLAGVDDATFEHERRIVRDEMRFRTENGTPGQAFGVLAAQVFPAGHPYARPVVGTEDSIDRLTLADARAFVTKYYRPNLAILTVSSPTRLEAQATLVAGIEAAHAWPRAQVSTRVPATSDAIVPSAAPQGLAVRELPVAGPTLWVGWSIPSEASHGSDAATLLAEMVDGTFWRHVDDRDRDIATVEAYVTPGVAASLFVVTATLNQGSDPQASADSLLHMILRGWGEMAYIQTDLEMYRRSKAADLVQEEEPIGSRTLNLAASAWLTGEPAYLRSRAERTIALTSGEVTDFYHRYLTAERAHVVLVRPPLERGGTARRRGPDADDFGLAARKVAEIEDLRPWMRAPGVSAAKRTTLPNGLDVVVLPRPGATFHTVVLAYHGGYADEQVLGTGVASLWGKQHYNEWAGAWGVVYSDRVHDDVTRETLHAAGSDLALTLKQLNREHEFRLFWPPRQFTARLESFQKDDDAAASRFERGLATALFGSHPYGRTTTTAELREVQARDVYGFLDAIRRPNNGVIVVVGDVDPDAAVELVTSELGAVAKPNAGPTRPPPAPPPLEHAAVIAGRRLLVEDRPGSTDAKLEFRCVLPKASGTYSAAYLIFASAIRVGMEGEFRERTATSYGMSVDYEIQRGGTATFELAGNIDQARLGYAIRELRRFVEEPMATFIDERRFHRARGDVARSFNLRLDGTEHLADSIVWAWNQGMPLEELDRVPERIESTTREEVLRLADYCRENWVLGLLGDEGRIRDAIGGWSP